jgi:DNA mismatch repair ATPase MutL
MAEGTVVSVRNLFFNTPARLKFMKRNETEAAHVGDLLTRLAISRPDVRFTYVNDGRTVFRALNSDLGNRISTLLGNTLASRLYPVNLASEGLKISGFIAGPDSGRSNASHFYTYINGRFIRDKVVQHAILQGYRNFMERRRYPVVVLFLEVPHGEVDVNVHPTKHEVRFREQGKVHDAIMEAVSSVLSATPWLRAGGKTGLPTSPKTSYPHVSTVKTAEVRESLARYRSDAEGRRIQTGNRWNGQEARDRRPDTKGKESFIQDTESVSMKAEASENAGVHRGLLCYMQAMPAKLRRDADSNRQGRDRGIPSERRHECLTDSGYFSFESSAVKFLIELL